MACPLPTHQIENLKTFIELLKKDSSFLHHPDLNFLKKYIESLGGKIPPKKAIDEIGKEESDNEEVESGESEVELDFDGCIEPDNDPPPPMGYTGSEVSEEDIEKSNVRKEAAIELHSEKKYEEAINAYTEAILLNPTSAFLYVKRGQCYLLLKKPNACIRDCTRALEINPDNAAAFKFRGRAHRLLGNFLKAAEDLRNACKIDFDEQADEWLKEVTPNARKLEEHQRKYERKRLEKEVKETKERIRKMRKEQQKRAAEMRENGNEFGNEGGEGGEDGGTRLKLKDLLAFTKDPEILQAIEDPEINAVMQELCQTSAKIVNYQSYPKVNSFLQKVFKYAKQGSEFSKGVPPELMGFPAFFGGANQETPKQPAPPTADIDLD